jgi:SPFH domain/Band 7 family protein
MFDRFLTFITDFIASFQFWWFMDPYEYGIILSGGKVRRKHYLKGPGGFGFLIPIWEKIAVARTDIHTNIMQPQSLITKDEIRITLKMACVWELSNVEMFLLRIADDEKVMLTQCYCAISEFVRLSEWKELLTKEWHQKLWNRVKLRAERYGVKMLEFELIELTKMDYAIRVFQETEAQW